MAIQPQTTDGRNRIALEKTTLPKKNFFTHDWTDPTTWYQKSIYVVDEVAADSGDHTTYTLANSNVIDLYHSKVYQEDSLLDSDGNSYIVIVKVDDVAKTEQDPHYGSGGDYTINYEDGAITFLSAQSSDAVVKVTYHYATTSEFTIAPDEGTAIVLDLVECQFAEDVVFNDSVEFQPYGFVEVFAPQYCTTNGGPYPPGTKIPLGHPLVYKSITDFQAEATRAYPMYPALGGSNWRGAPVGITVFDWDYLSSTRLRSDYGMEVRLKLQHDTAFGGWYATATFYCLSEDL